MDKWIQKAQSAKDSAELLALAKNEGFAISQAEADVLFAKIHASSAELSDKELEDVAGGGCGQSRPQPKFCVGDRVRSRGYAACEGISGFSCRSTYIVVENVSYYNAYSRYCYTVSCPVCHVSKQVWEHQLQLAEQG